MKKTTLIVIVLSFFCLVNLAWGEMDLKKIKKLAESGDAEAQFNLGVMYEDGKGVPQSYAEAVKWFRKAADQGYAKAQFSLGRIYLWSKYGNYAEAMKWYRKAADQGYVEAQFNMGLLYDDFRGVPQNYAEAMKWYRKAADQGHAAAQFNLAMMFSNGKGVPQNFIKAYVWLSVASANGDKATKKYLDDILSPKMTPQQIAQAQNEAAELREKINKTIVFFHPKNSRTGVKSFSILIKIS